MATNIQVKGKFLYHGNEKFYVKGVTYGTFCPDREGNQFPDRETVRYDFQQMAEQGINSVRTYTVPPRWMLDLAQESGLMVMVGLPWEQHITFLDNAKTTRSISQRVKELVETCKGHPAILCYTIGNEIPAGIVRWHGKRRIESFLKSLFYLVKKCDPGALVTYVNYPTTEYLDLSFMDFMCFNVYLETPEKLSGYLSRLQTLCGDKPLVMAEIGLDSLRNGEEKQASILTWQVETVFGKGCAGMFVFAWTDQWWRGGFEIEDWDFGLVTRDREPKPALQAVRSAYGKIPVCLEHFPMISVVVSSYNGAATIRECLTGILQLDYPRFEVIVINDGSKDGLENIVKDFPVKLISTPNRGLSRARNTGMQASEGDIIAYIDDDAFPDPHWLRYIAYAYATTDHACIGGPNYGPPDDGPIATAVANAPGGPVQVLLTEEIAEHVPGCNMTFRKEALVAIGGFDPVFRTAGDDVDVCWRLQQTGRTVGFHPAALVWHRRRNSLRAYWKQQRGYGKAEALLEAKWPEKYNRLGHLTWAGRIYGNGVTLPIQRKKEKVFHGVWGTAAFQSVYGPATHLLSAIPLMPEWYLFTAFFGILGSMGFIWTPLLWCWAVFGFSIFIVVLQAVISARKNIATSLRQAYRPKLKWLITWLHILQPVARLYGRINHGLTPWRFRGAGPRIEWMFRLFPTTYTYWSEEWHSQEEWLTGLERSLVKLKCRVKRGGPFDRWDLQAETGIFTSQRCLLAIEEHGAGKQYLRLKTKLHIPFMAFMVPVALTSLIVFSVLSSEWIIAALAGLMLAGCATAFFIEKTSTQNSIYLAFNRPLRSTRSGGESKPVSDISIPEEHTAAVVKEKVKKQVAAP